MPIVFSCSCGKAMKAKEALAGRKIKCSVCGKVVTIPHPEPEEKKEVPAPPPLAKPVARPFSRPEPETDDDEAADSPPLAKPVARSLFTDDDDDAEDDAPPLARPVVHKRPAPTMPQPLHAAFHAWVDQSLVQNPTPWLPGDEARFQQGVKKPREGMSGLELGVLGIVVLGLIGTAAWWVMGK